jgi:hypothetical protein
VNHVLNSMSGCVSVCIGPKVLYLVVLLLVKLSVVS